MPSFLMTKGRQERRMKPVGGFSGRVRRPAAYMTRMVSSARSSGVTDGLPRKLKRLRSVGAKARTVA